MKTLYQVCISCSELKDKGEFEKGSDCCQKCQEDKKESGE